MNFRVTGRIKIFFFGAKPLLNWQGANENDGRVGASVRDLPSFWPYCEGLAPRGGGSFCPYLFQRSNFSSVVLWAVFQPLPMSENFPRDQFLVKILWLMNHVTMLSVSRYYAIHCNLMKMHIMVLLCRCLQEFWWITTLIVLAKGGEVMMRSLHPCFSPCKVPFPILMSFHVSLFPTRKRLYVVEDHANHVRRGLIKCWLSIDRPE